MKEQLKKVFTTHSTVTLTASTKNEHTAGLPLSIWQNNTGTQDKKTLKKWTKQDIMQK